MTLQRILIPAYDFKPLLGGVANYVHELAVQFSRRARVHVVSRKLPGMEEFDRDLPYAITRIQVPYSAVFATPLFTRTLRQVIRVPLGAGRRADPLLRERPRHRSLQGFRDPAEQRADRVGARA
jgi:hypothetical protein